VQTNIAILGAGASGLFLAHNLKTKDYILIDHNQIPQKIKVSGGGKCNFTNEFVDENNYLGDKLFIKKVLGCYSQKDVLKFFKDINYKKIKNNQYFASSSDEIIKKLNTKKFIATIEKVEKKDKFIIHTSKGKIFANKVVVATGGVSFKSLGASDIGYKIAQNFGHDITPIAPALVGLTLQKENFWMKSLSGVSVFCEICVGDKVFRDNILFSHRGISGPAVLNASLYWKKGQIKINFLPNYKNKCIPKKSPSNFLNLPKRFVVEFLKTHNIEDIPKNLPEIIQKLQNYFLAPAGTFGFAKAEVTKGGVDVGQLNNFESKFCPNLYFIGEVVDVTGELGGYNFQWCFSSAFYLSNILK